MDLSPHGQPLLVDGFPLEVPGFEFHLEDFRDLGQATAPFESDRHPGGHAGGFVCHSRSLLGVWVFPPELDNDATARQGRKRVIKRRGPCGCGSLHDGETTEGGLRIMQHSGNFRRRATSVWIGAVLGLLLAVTLITGQALAARAGTPALEIIEESEAEAYLLQKINEERLAEGREALAVDPLLVRLAAGKGKGHGGKGLL